MGGTLRFPDDRIHQILGIVLLVLWIFHTAMNRRWFTSLFRGKYPPFRIMQIAVNLCISLCARSSVLKAESTSSCCVRPLLSAFCFYGLNVLNALIVRCAAFNYFPGTAGCEFRAFVFFEDRFYFQILNAF